MSESKTTEPSENKTTEPTQSLFEKQREAAVQRHLRWAENVQLVRQQVAHGRFGGVPDWLARLNYHFVRVGLKGDARAERRAIELCEKGYQLAPPGVYAIGFESDGERGLIICAPPEVYRNLHEDKMARGRIRRQRMKGATVQEIEARLRAQLPGVDLAFAAKIGNGGEGAFRQDVAAAVREARGGSAAQQLVGRMR